MTTTVQLAAASAATAMYQAVGSPDTTVRVVLEDPSGRLRVFATQGESTAIGRRRSRRRRQAFETGREVVVESASPGGHSLSIHPMLAGDRAVGVVEVLAPRGRIEERREAVAALVRQSAVLVKLSKEREDTERNVRALRRLLDVTSEVGRATGAVAAMAAVAEACSDHTGKPVAIVRPDRSGEGWFLAAATGLGARKRRELREALRSTSVAGRRDRRTKAVVGVFERVVASPAAAFPVADAHILTPSDGDDGFVRGAASVLERRLSDATGTAEPDDVRVGLAWTAHELKGPLVGARAAIEQVLTAGQEHTSSELLRKTKLELDHLSQIVDPLLQWSTGGGSLQKRRVDLVDLTRRAAASCAFEGDDRIVVDGPDRLFVRADPVLLHGAIANVVRNALAYSPRASAVDVRVERTDRGARVSVRDRGTGITPEEREKVFAPFVRGSEGRNGRAGNGLGLFIARRALEAHGGRLGLRVDRAGTVFTLELPAGPSS